MLKKVLRQNLTMIFLQGDIIQMCHIYCKLNLILERFIIFAFVYINKIINACKHVYFYNGRQITHVKFMLFK
jgi:hypothetical protein